jgi:hypothetical protein
MGAIADSARESTKYDLIARIAGICCILHVYFVTTSSSLDVDMVWGLAASILGGLGPPRWKR